MLSSMLLRPRALAVAAVLAAALCFSTTGTARALADVDASALSVGAARIALGGGVLGILALLAARARRRRLPTTLRAVAATGRASRADILTVSVGSLGVLAYQPAFFAGTQENGVAVGTVVALGSAPIATGLLEGILRRRVPRAAWFAATACATAGLVLVAGATSGDSGGSSVALGGLAASVGAGLAYAAYALASKRLLDRGWSPVGAMGAVFGWAAVASVPVLVLTAPSWLLTPRGAALTLWLGLVTVALAYLLFAWGLARLSATTAATLTLAEPLVATLLGVAVMREPISLAAAAGLALIAVGLAMVSVPGRSERRGNPMRPSRGAHARTASPVTPDSPVAPDPPGEVPARAR